MNTTNKHNPPKVSIIIPLYNEGDNIQSMHDGLVKTLSDAELEFELIFVNDGSSDHSEKTLNRLIESQPHLVVLHLMRNKGKAAALEVGVQHAGGKYIVIIDCDLQYDPEDIVRMIAELDKGYDMVSGRRMNREDTKHIILTSKVFNFLIGKMTGLKFADYFSGLKCFNREVVNYLSLYGALYRFAVVYAYVQGFKVIEIPVKHYARKRGVSRYSSVKRIVLSIADILTVLMTVVLNVDRVYYLNLLGLSCMVVGTTLSIVHFFWALPSLVISIGVLLVGAGVYTLILKKLSSDFFARHQLEFSKRKKNLRCVLRSESFNSIEAL